jgi:hypothetical protein
MQNSSSQTVSVVVKNYGNETAQGVYLLPVHRNGFIVSPDSIAIGDLLPDQVKTATYQLQAPNNDTIGGYRLDVFSANAHLYTQGSAVISTNNANGISLLKNQYSFFRIFPVPTNNFINIEKLSPVDGEITASLLDMTGREILSTKLFASGQSRDVLNISSYASGIYTLKIATSFGNQVFKVTKP